MRTTISTSGTTHTSRGASVATAVAALCLSLPMVAAFSGTALAATADNSKATADHGNSAAAPGQVRKDEAPTTAAAVAAKPADFIGPVAPAATGGTTANTTSVPLVNQGGVTAGSGTPVSEVVNGRSGSPAVGGAQPSGGVLKPQPLSNADLNAGGANNGGSCGAYCSTRDGAPSLNGNGGGQQSGQPCAGCVGKADNKNPPGQAPNGSDHNNGYECDGNHGVGRTNPAHTGCKPPVVVCVPKLGEDSSCNPPKCIPTAQQDKDCKTPGKACVPVGNQDPNCNPPKDCLGVVNGTATAATCHPPVVCPAAGTIGPAPAGCSIGGGTDNPATRPVTPITGRTVVPATLVTPIAGDAVTPARALPFTGSNTTLLLEISVLMLAVGGGLMMATRKPRPAIARL